MLNLLMGHKKFDSYLKKIAPSRDLEDIMATIKQKVSAWQEKWNVFFMLVLRLLIWE